MQESEERGPGRKRRVIKSVRASDMSKHAPTPMRSRHDNVGRVERLQAADALQSIIEIEAKHAGLELEIVKRSRGIMWAFLLNGKRRIVYHPSAGKVQYYMGRTIAANVMPMDALEMAKTLLQENT